MSDDFLDEMMRPESDGEQERDPRAGIAVVGRRFESSEEMERAEQIFFECMRAHPLEQIGLFYDGAALEPLSREDKAILKANRVTVDEFLELVGTE